MTLRRCRQYLIFPGSCRTHNLEAGQLAILTEWVPWYGPSAPSGLFACFQGRACTAARAHGVSHASWQAVYHISHASVTSRFSYSRVCRLCICTKFIPFKIIDHMRARLQYMCVTHYTRHGSTLRFAPIMAKFKSTARMVQSPHHTFISLSPSRYVPHKREVETSPSTLKSYFAISLCVKFLTYRVENEES
jgi:hypothetical protein